MTRREELAEKLFNLLDSGGDMEDCQAIVDSIVETAKTELGERFDFIEKYIAIMDPETKKMVRLNEHPSNPKFKATTIQ